MWQYTTAGRVSGIEDKVDLNAFYGSSAEWAKFLATDRDPRQRHRFAAQDWIPSGAQVTRHTAWVAQVGCISARYADNRRLNSPVCANLADARPFASSRGQPSKLTTS